MLIRIYFKIIKEVRRGYGFKRIGHGLMAAVTGRKYRGFIILFYLILCMLAMLCNKFKWLNSITLGTY